MSKKTASPKTPPQDFALNLCGVDSHTHLDSKEFNEDLGEVLARAKQCGVEFIGNVFLSPENYINGKELFVNNPEVFYILGIHPMEGQDCTETCVESMYQCFMNDTRIKAVGEIGLDFYWDTCPRELQYQALERQLHLAKKVQRPVAIHSRDAVPETIAFLEAQGFKDYPLLWHCFGSTMLEAKKIISNGWHISIPGHVSYKANAHVREALAHIPLDRIMLETDCPYLSPNEWRGRRNEPAFTVFTVRYMAEALNMDVQELWEICGNNAKGFFGLK